VRRGGCIGLMAFPVANKEELLAVADRYGIEQRLVLSNRERWNLVEGVSGLDFFNQVMSVIEPFRRCDVVLAFVSPKWIRLAQALLEGEVLAVEIGPTPVSGDITVDPGEVERMLKPFIKD
jgi:hypothetical protein